jgi:antirestriction protein ArdC
MNVYDIVTQKMIERLEAGTVPWRKPWASDGRPPMNLVSGKAYTGVNSWLLNVAGYGSPYWLTINQANERGATLRDGERYSIAVFTKQWTPKEPRIGAPVDKDGKPKALRVLRYYRVYNAEQFTGLDYPRPQARALDFNPIEACETIVASMPAPPTLQHVEARAYYQRRNDLVNIPPRESFEAEPEYYSTLFHELVHSTGHETRLARAQEATSKMDGAYAREELVAELGGAYLCNHAGIAHRTLANSAAYCASWIARLKGDSKLIVQAASRASKAANWILGELPDDKGHVESEEN